MKRLLLLFGFLLLFAGKVHAQAEIPHLPADPPICDSNRGLLYLNTVTGKVRQCTAPNTWSDLPAGAATTANSLANTPTTCTNQKPDGVDAQGNAVNCQSVASTSANNTWTAQQNFDANQRFKGPNPYVDVTAFGARAIAPFSTPGITGITGNITSGQTSLTVSTSSCAGQTGNVCFVNGDGIVVYGAGATQAMATPGAPTVTPSISRLPPGTRDTVAGPAGATTYNYQIFAEDAGGGLTAVSTVGSTATGAASLGQQSVSITSCSRANDVVTCTTSGAHGLNTNSSAQLIFITGVADGSFNGWWQTSTVADNTHFAYVSTLDTRNGATTSTTGGTVNWWSCNHVTWSAVTGAYRYWIAGRTGGSLTTIGYSWPTNTLNGGITEGVTSWDDFGSPMMDHLHLPGWIPSTPPASATSDNLSTTITAGGGTTSLTLANAAGTTVTGAGVLLDNAPALKAAVAASITGGTVSASPVRFPADASGNSYVINSLVDISATQRVTLEVAGNIVLAAPIKLANWSKITGISPSTAASVASFAFESLPQITETTAYPGIHLVGGVADRIEGVQFSGSSGFGGGNNQILVLQDFGSANPGTTYNRVQFTTGTGASGDYMGLGLLNRGINGTLAGEFNFDQVQVLSGATGTTALFSGAPSTLCMECGQVKIKALMVAGRGMHIGFDATGNGSVNIDWGYTQGGAYPFISTSGGSSNIDAIRLDQITLDTFVGPMVSTYTGASGFPFLYITNMGVASGAIGGNLLYTGQKPFNIFETMASTAVSTKITARDTSAYRHDTAIDGTINTSSSTPRQSLFYNNEYIGVGPSYGIFVDSPPMAAPGTAVVAGGSVPVGTHTYQITPVWQNGSFGNASFNASATTSGGNQQVNLTWTPLTGCKGYVIIRDGGILANPPYPTVAGCASNSFSDTAAAGSGISAPVIPMGGPTMLMPGTQGIAAPLVQAPNLVSNGGSCTNAELVLSAGWQSTGTATVTAAAGLNQTCSWTITTGTTTGANPTVTDTLINALPNANIVCEMNIHGGTHTAAAGEGFQQTTLSATAPVFTFQGTPTAGGTTYFVTRRCGP